MRWIAQYVADDQVDEAARWGEAALKSYPNRAEIWNDTGVTRQLRGDWAGADSAWAEALRLDPKNPAALFNRAVFERFYRLDRVAARRAFERFLTLGIEIDEALADRMAEDRK
jgi:tetratricopeptide (TPR) repeat protein